VTSFSDDFSRCAGAGPAWELPEDPFDLHEWDIIRRGNATVAIKYDPVTETYIYAVNSPKARQEFADLMAELPENPQVDSADSGGETKHPASREDLL
jgi:hypothetical protein